MKEEKVQTNNKHGEKLVGIESRPDEQLEKYPAVILVHGFGVTKEEYGMFDDLAKHLADAGILSYRFDFSGCGESEGDYGYVTLTKLRDDLESILSFVKSLDYVDQDRIGIHAQSMGTATTITLHPNIQSLLFTGTISQPNETLSRMYKDGYNPNGITTIRKSDGRTIKLQPDFWRDLDKHNLVTDINEFTCPILFIHGEKDFDIPLSNMMDYFNVYRGKKEKVILEGADHGLEPGRDRLYTIAVDWFKKTL